MADDPESADDERSTELTAISYIFPELQLDPKIPFTASLDISVSPVNPLPVIFPALNTIAPSVLPTPPIAEDIQSEAQNESSTSKPQVHRLSHLPPLKLVVSLPVGYPSSAPPNVTLGFREAYVPQNKLKSLRDKVLELWEENGHSEVLYDYIDYLQQAAEDAFRIAPEDEPLPLPQELEIPLLDFDLKTKRAKFERETFECGVCLEPKKGAVCHRLKTCGHVFCKACLQDFYNNCITEGDVFNVKCMDPSCEKDLALRDPPDAQPKKHKKVDRTLNPSELLEIPIEQEQVQRYVKIKRKKELEADKNTVYCPRKWCQGPARTSRTSKPGNDEEEEDDESPEPEPEAQDEGTEADEDKPKKEVKLPPPSERLAVCTECSFAFCSVCLQGWHGEIVYCHKPRDQKELSAEEKATEDYLSLHSTRCPTCDSRCQKSMGCNHMHCNMCLSHFCYLCSAWLDSSNPYAHFNTEGTPCYQRLWEMEGGDNEGVVPHVFPNRQGDHLARRRNNNAAGAGNNQAQEARAPAPAPPRPPPRAPEPPAAAPPRRANNGQQWELPPGIRINRRAQQGLVPGQRGPPAQPNPVRDEGLQRFLEMVQDDREDEWDSDEMDDDDWEIPIRVR